MSEIQQAISYMRTYAVAIEHENDGNTAYCGHFPDFNFEGTPCSIHTAADEFKDIRKESIDALESGIGAILEDGAEVPFPQDLSYWMAHEDWKDYLWITVTVDIGKLLAE